MVASNNKREVYLPHIGTWNKTGPNSLPPAGSTHLGLWLDTPTPSIGFFCVLFYDCADEPVDPATDKWVRFAFHTRQGHRPNCWDLESVGPDYWAECRFLIPVNQGGDE